MASDWLKKKAQEQARDNGKLSQTSKSNNQGIASDWLRNKAREQSAPKVEEKTTVTTAAPIQPSAPIQKRQVGGKFLQQSLGDDVLPTGTPMISQKMQRY